MVGLVALDPPDDDLHGGDPLKKLRPMEIEVPVTPMLDMAFQLLTFFILTYRPAPTEGQFSMNLLPAQQATEITKEQPKEQPTQSVDASLRTLKTTLRAGDNGLMGEMVLADKPISGLPELKTELEGFVNDKDSVFDQAVISVDPRLRYSEVVKVIDVFSSLKPKPLTKISFSELDDESGGRIP
jgi:biopolymer transport protein ExbD